jgi:hypothetical protein
MRDVGRVGFTVFTLVTSAACGAFSSSSDSNGGGSPDGGVDGGEGGASISGPATQVSKSPAPVSITTDADSVYWTDRVDGVVRAAPKSGGDSRQVSTSGDLPDYLALDGDTLYWLQTRVGCPGHPHLLSHPKAQTGDPGVIWPNDSNCYTTYRMATVPGLFFYVQQDNMIVEVSKNDGNRNTLANNEAIINGIAGDGNGVFWGAQNSIRTVTQPGTGAAPFVEGLEGTPMELAVDATSIFFIDDKGNVQRVDRSPPKSLPQKLVSGTGAQRIALDGDNVYWTDKNASAVKTVPKKGGDARVIADNQNGPFAIAVDATGVYWSTLGDGKIMSVKR